MGETMRLWFAILLLFVAKPAGAAVLHVAPTGSDTGPGTLDRPFATLARARDAARQSPQPDTIQVRGGTYFLEAPLVLGPQDSGLTIAACENEKPVISGGRRITGWRPTTNQLWTTEIPGHWYFHQLWVNGQRRPRARHPNRGHLTVAGVPDLTPKTPRYPGQNRFQFAPGDIKAWQNLADVDVVLLHLWVSVRLAVTSVDEPQRIVTFLKPSRRRMDDSGVPPRYYVENAPELLDVPGEWYLNRQSGILTYWPLPGERLDQAEIIAPVHTQIIRLENTERVTLRGLTFAHTEWWPARDDPCDKQAAVNVPGAVVGEGMRHGRIESCQFHHLGSYALELSRGSRSNVVTNCVMSDLGGGGVKIGAEKADHTRDNDLTACHIHDGGKIFHQAVGVWVGQSDHNRILQNHIHDFHYTGISVGWTWGYGASAAHHNLIASNQVDHIGVLTNGSGPALSGVEGPLLSDLGGIYTLGHQPGTVIRDNTFHDIAAARYGGWGIYFDEGSSEILAERNLIYRTTHGGFHQHYGRDNIIRHNIFAFGRDHQLQRSRVEEHLSFIFERNIVYWDNGKLVAGDWSKNVRVASNLYWRADGKFTDSGQFVADPLFVDPTRGDFRLRPGSPAFTLGFTP